MRTNAIFPRNADNLTIPVAAPLGSPIAKTYDSDISSATSISLNAATTYFEVTAIAQGVILRYAAGASTTDFDAVIPANTTRGFAVPSGVTTISVLAEAANAHVAVTEF